MFQLLDSHRLPDSADDLAWNAWGDKLVVGSWPERRSWWGQKGYDAFVAVLEIKGGQLHQTHQFKLNARAKGDDVVAFSPDDRYIAVGNTTVELFDLQENRRVWVTEHGIDGRPDVPRGHRALVFSGDGRLLSVAEGHEGKNTVLYWGEFNLSDGRYVAKTRSKLFQIPLQIVQTVGRRWSVTPEMSPYEERPFRNWFSVRELAGGQELWRFDPRRPPGGRPLPTAFALSADGRYLAIAGQRGLDRPDGGGVPAAPGTPEKPSWAFVFAYLQLWDVAENRLLHEYLVDDTRRRPAEPLPSSALIKSLDFSPDGRWLLMRQNDPQAPNIHVLDVVTGQYVWSSEGPTGPGVCRFSPSGEMFACRGERKTLVFKKHK
ncbi:MAG: PD40 domain-containing protein [Candidatus Accumulibacter sp.]|nr:PD40 domain-containing protein [Accumulibacter sp.]